MELPAKDWRVDERSHFFEPEVGVAHRTRCHFCGRPVEAHPMGPNPRLREDARR